MNSIALRSLKNSGLKGSEPVTLTSRCRCDELTNRAMKSPFTWLLIDHFGKYHNILCLSPQILHKHCFQFLLGLTTVPRENKNNAYAKIWGDKQRVLWYFPKWPFSLWTPGACDQAFHFGGREEEKACVGSCSREIKERGSRFLPRVQSWKRFTIITKAATLCRSY